MKPSKSVFALLLASLLAFPACKGDSPLAGTDSSQEEIVAPLPPAETPENSVQPEPTPTPEPEPEPEPIVVKASYFQNTGENVNLRSGAGTNFTVLGVAEKGTVYAITGKTGGWYKTYYRGKTAYLSASYASVFSLEKSEDEVERVIEEGYKLIGTPYVYGAVRFHDGTGKLLGGFTVQKFDCSSLVQYIFYKGAGKILGVHTRAQVKQGTFVKRNDLRRGDCIFFTNEQRQWNTGLERVGHVALYLGDGYILHTSSDYARIEKMTAKRWGFYIEARRFV